MTTNNEKLIALRTGQVQASRTGDYWSKEELAEMAEMFDAGYGISEMAIHFGRTEIGIYQQLFKGSFLAPQCRPRVRQPKNYEPKCLCPFCAIPDCPNHRKEGAHAGGIR